MQRALRGRLPVAAVALLLLARLLAVPAVGAAAPAGSVPICMGGQIVYMALDAHGDPVSPDEAGSIPCPWLGQVAPHALPVPAALPLPSAMPEDRPAMPAAEAPVLASARGHDARAPPPSFRPF
jgi:hypothetical protein